MHKRVLFARAIIAWLLSAVMVTAGPGVVTFAAEQTDSSNASVEREDQRTRAARAGRRDRTCRRSSARNGLQAAVRRAGAGATLCLGPGRYTVSSPLVLKNGQRLVGAGPGRTIVTTSRAHTVIEARGRSGVTISGMSISGGVGGVRCKPKCGRGIKAGAKMRISNVRVHNNDLLGISGSAPGLVITNSQIDHNGSRALFGCCAGGIKSAHSYTITGSRVHDNTGVGIWCDVGCHGSKWQVSGNVVLRNALGGIRYERSYPGAVIRGNVVQGNNRSGSGGHGGIEVNSSRNVVVERNVLGGNRVAGIVANGRRPPGLVNVSIRNNALRGDKLSGCGGRVACSNNR